jgi:hypothetical protein
LKYFFILCHFVTKNNYFCPALQDFFASDKLQIFLTKVDDHCKTQKVSGAAFPERFGYSLPKLLVQ